MGDKHKTNFDIKNSTIEGSLISGGAKADGDIVGRDKNIFQQIISSRLLWVIILLLTIIVVGVLSNLDLPLITPLKRYLNGRQGDETLIVIAHFHAAEAGRASNVHNQLFNTLQEEITNQKLTNIRVVLDPTILLSSQRTEAEAIGQEYDATMIIWGEDTEFQVVANYLGLREQTETINLGQAESQMTYLVNPDKYQQFVLQNIAGSSLSFALLALGNGLGFDKKYDQALVLLKLSLGSGQLIKNLQQDELIAKIHFSLGNVYFGLEKYEEAIVAYERVIELDPQDVLSYNNLGLTYYGLGQYEEAIVVYERAIELNPQYALSYNNLGLTYYGLGQYEEAIIVYERAIELNPQYPSPYHNLGVAYTILGRYEQAITSYKYAIELDPQLAESHHNLGFIYIILKRYEESIIALEKAIQLNPQYILAHYNSGFVYFMLGRHKEAMVSLKKASELDPQWAEPHNGLGNVYYELGRYEEAITAYQKYLELSPNAPDKAVVEATIQELQQKIAEP